MKLEEFLKRNYNYDTTTRDYLEGYITQWQSWYQGNVKNFHNYFIYNGQKKVTKQRYSMNMAKEISEDWSDILWSEKCKISMNNENSQAVFEELINDLDIYTLINRSIEKSGAIGTDAQVVSVYDLKLIEDKMLLDSSEAKVRIDNVSIDWVFPLSWNNKEITECAFGSRETKDGITYIKLSVHQLANEKYVIYNHLFKEQKGNLTEIEQEDTIREFNTNSNIKWFSIFRPLLTNNITDNSPFGMPHYANAIDNLKAVDIAFDEFKNELMEGRRRTFVRADMLSYEEGTQKMVFDPNDTTTYVLPKGANKDDLIQSDIVDLRTDKQISSVNFALNVLGNKVGFGENHYHFDGTNLSTATAVISSNSKMFRRKKKLEIGYESAIYDLIKAICYASSEFGKHKINTEDMVIKFDDSIIEDKEAESNRALRELSAGVISKEEYRQNIFGETPEIAKEKVQKIKENEPTVEDLIGE